MLLQLLITSASTCLKNSRNLRTTFSSHRGCASSSLVRVVDEPVALGAALPLGRLDHRRQLVPVVTSAAATVPIAAEKDNDKSLQGESGKHTSECF